MKKVVALLLFSMLFSMFALVNVSAAADSDPNPSGDYIKYTVTVNRPEDETGAAFCFDTIRRFTDYIIEEGDVLEYDVYSSVDEAGWGAIDGEIQDWGVIRDIPGITDQNGKVIHTGENLSEYNFEKWYHRVINIAVNEDESAKPTIGKKLQQIQVAMHPGSGEDQITGVVYYDNIVITNNGVEKLVIFRDASDYKENEVKHSHKQFIESYNVELATFTAEEATQILADMNAEKEAEIQASIEASERKESMDISRAEAEASRQASIEQSSKDAEAELSQNNETTTGSSSADEEESSLILWIIIIAAAVVVIIVVIVLVSKNGKKK